MSTDTTSSEISRIRDRATTVVLVGAWFAARFAARALDRWIRWTDADARAVRRTFRGARRRRPRR